mgnify:CR=1 FL=1
MGCLVRRPVFLRSLSSAAILLGGLLLDPSTLKAQRSANYAMERVTVSASASHLESASFGLDVTLAQEGPVGSLSYCNVGYLQSTGFWSVLGEHPAPIVLEVNRNELVPEGVDLAWTGSAALFDVYRAELPSSVADLPNLMTTTKDCVMGDIPPLEPDVLYYLVVPAEN